MRFKSWVGICSFLMLASATFVSADTNALNPDSYVRGEGKALGSTADSESTAPFSYRFDISKYKDTYYGGFIVSPIGQGNNAIPQVISRSLKSVSIQDGAAEIDADAWIDGKIGCVSIEITSGNPSTFKITFEDCSSNDPLKTWTAVVQNGTLKIVANINPVYGYAKGIGAIEIVRKNEKFPSIGSFGFKVENPEQTVAGVLSYTEIDPLQPYAERRPLAKIYLLKAEKFSYKYNSAQFEGQGLYNGRLAWIAVRVTMYSDLVAEEGGGPDLLYLSVRPSEAIPVELYSVAGYLASGSIQVGELSLY